MKKKFKISTLIFGIVVAVLAFSNSKSYADTFEKVEYTEVETLDIEMAEVIEMILDEKNTVIPQDKSLKIYNFKSQLVYETNDKSDDHLKILLRRSNLVLQTDTSSYYLLGD